MGGAHVDGSAELRERATRGIYGRTRRGPGAGVGLIVLAVAVGEGRFALALRQISERLIEVDEALPFLVVARGRGRPTSLRPHLEPTV
jgi:hypothetical protein